MKLKGELWAQACARQECEAKEADTSQRRSRLPPKPADNQHLTAHHSIQLQILLIYRIYDLSFKLKKEFNQGDPGNTAIPAILLACLPCKWE